MTQLFLVGSIVIIAIVSVANLPVEFQEPVDADVAERTVLSILGTRGICDGTLAARFQFAAVSNEGRGLAMRTSPISAKEFSHFKAYPGILPMILVGETLAVSSITILDAHLPCCGSVLEPQLHFLLDSLVSLWAWGQSIQTLKQTMPLSCYQSRRTTLHAYSDWSLLYLG